MEDLQEDRDATDASLLNNPKPEFKPAPPPRATTAYNEEPVLPPPIAPVSADSISGSHSGSQNSEFEQSTADGVIRDPALLAQLNGRPATSQAATGNQTPGQPDDGVIRDPQLLAQLNGTAPANPQADDGVIRDPALLAQLNGQTATGANPMVDTAMSVLKAIKGSPLSLPALIPHYWGEAVKSITGQPWMPGIVKDYGKEYNAIAQMPTLAGHNLAMIATPQENQQSLSTANENFGPAAPYVTGFAHGYLNGYVPETETKHGTLENMGQEVANLLGMAMNMQVMSTKAVVSALERIAPGAVNKIWGSVAKLLGTGGLAYGAYLGQTPGADYNPQQALMPQAKEYLENHLQAALKGAVLGKLFAIGGGIANVAITKLLPSAPKWLADTIGASILGAGIGLTQPANDLRERLRNGLIGAPVFAAAHILNPYSYQTEGKPSEGKGTTAEPPEGAAIDLQAGLDKMNALDEQLGYAQTPDEQTQNEQTQNEGQSSSSAPEGQQAPDTEPQTPEGKAEAETAPESYEALKELHYPDDEIVDMDAGRARDIIDNEILYKPAPVNAANNDSGETPPETGVKSQADWPSLESQLKALGYSNEEMDGMSLNDARSIVESHEQPSAEEGQRPDIQKQLEALGVKSEPETSATATPEQVIYTTRVGNRYVKEKLEFDEAMGKLFDAVDNKDNTLHRVIYDEVSDDTAEKMRQSAKDSNADIDVSGYRHSIDNYFIKHELERHGDLANEEDRGQLPITKEDIAMIPEIVKNYDNVEYAGKNKDGFLYTKRINGEIYYVEDVRTRQKGLAATSLFKKKASGTNDMPSPEKTSSVESHEQPSGEEGQSLDIQKQLKALGVKSEPEAAGTAMPEQVIYTTRADNRYFKENLDYDEAINRLFDAVDSKDNTLHRVIYDEVSDDTAEKMRQSAIDSNVNIDVSGYRHSIDNSFIKHALKRHGESAIEEDRGQLPITKEDIAMIPDIVKNYDNVEYAGKTDQNKDGFLYTKRINGEIYFIEEVRSGQKELAATSLLKKKATRASDMPSAENPAPTSETLPGLPPSDYSVQRPDEAVKSEKEPEQSSIKPKNPLSNESGAVDVDKLAGMAGVDVDKLKEQAKVHLDEVVAAGKEIKGIFAPASMSEEAARTAGSLRERNALMDRKKDIAVTSSKKISAFFDSQPKEVNYQFIDDMELGKKQANPKLQEIADLFRKALDDRFDKVNKLDPNAQISYMKNFFPHLYKDPEKAARIIDDYFAKGRLEGSKSFFMPRKIPTLKFARELGLEQLSDNPNEMFLQRLFSMDKYIMAHEFMTEMKGKELFQFIGALERVPADLKQVGDPLGEVWRINEKGELIRVGGYYGPRDAVGVLNNYLSPGLRGSKIFSAYLSAGNVLNQAQLGLSAWHAATSSVNAMLNQFSLGMEKVLGKGSVKEGLTDMATFLKAPFTDYAKGGELLNAFDNPVYKSAYRDEVKDISKSLKMEKFSNPDNAIKREPLSEEPVNEKEIQAISNSLDAAKELLSPSLDGEVQDIARALMAGGGAARQDIMYQTQMADKMTEAFRKGNAIEGLLRSPFALLEQAASPIFQKLVPRLKLGAFYQLALMELKRNPQLLEDSNREQLRDLMGKAWDSIDNRMGQVRYDNIFWNKVFKDLLMASVRSVGWTGGTIREIGGGLIDTVKASKSILSGQKPTADMMTHRMAYTLSLVTMTGIMGAVTQYLLTRKGPDTSSISSALTDLYYPRTGNLDEYGNPARMSYPTYMKDIIAYGKHPLTTITNKVHPLLSLISDMLNNKDFYGHKVYNEGDPLTQKAIDLAKHAGLAFEPFAFRGAYRNYQLNEGRINEKTFLPFIGITPAPANISKTPAQKMMDEERAGKAPMGGRTTAEQAKADTKLQIERLLRKDPQTGAQLLRESLSKFSPREIDNMLMSRSTTPYTAAFKRLPVEDALKVFSVSTPAEKREFAPLLGNKLDGLDKLSQDRKKAAIQQLRNIGLLK